MIRALFCKGWLCLLVLWANNLHAHALHAVAQFDGKQITGTAFYSDQTPAKQTYVSAKLLGHTLELEGKTDNQGQFTFATEQAGEYLVTVEGEEGHKITVSAKQTQIRTADSDQFALLRQDIAQLKHKLYFHDIISGIGYIFGFVGLLAFYRSRKK